MHASLWLYCARRSNEGLTGDLSAEDSLLFRWGTNATKHVDLNWFEIKKGEKSVYCGLSHPPNLPQLGEDLWAFFSHQCRPCR